MNGWYDVRPNRCIGNNQSMRIADPAELHKKLLDADHSDKPSVILSFSSSSYSTIKGVKLKCQSLFDGNTQWVRFLRGLQSIFIHFLCK
jgi:hypothetical protein